MRLTIQPITVDGVTCAEAEVSVAVSNTTAISFAPVDASGTTHPDGALGIVGTPDTPDIGMFMDAIAAAVAQLAEGRGI